jgi:AraC-like DNA-binding protein
VGFFNEMHEHLKTHSSRDVAWRAQIDYWNDLITDSFTALKARPGKRTGFDAKLQRAPLAELSIAEVSSEPTIVSHTREMITQEITPLYLVHLQLVGSSINRQDSREALLKEGDFTLCDTKRPYDVAFTDRNDMLVLRIPEQKLKQLLHSPDDLTCIRMSGSHGMSRVKSSFLREVWQNYNAIGDVANQKKIADILINTLAISFSEITKDFSSDSSLKITRRSQIKRFIETNLYDIRLTPAFIAEAFAISKRYLHVLFEGEEETLTQYILRRRLDDAIILLTDESQRHLTISEIAYRVGFNSSNHFGRVYKERFGQTPSESRDSKFCR